MNLSKSAIYSAFCFSMASLGLMAQEEPKKNLGSEVVHVVKAYDPSVSDASKINIEPELDNSNRKKLPVEYSVRPVQMASNFEAKPVGAAGLTQPKQAYGRASYLTAGFGTYFTPLFDLYLNNKKAKKKSYGLHAHLLSSQGGIKDIELDDSYTKAGLEAFYNVMQRYYSANFSLGYNYNQYNYYGLNTERYILQPGEEDSFNFANLDVAQAYQTATFKADFQNGRKDSWFSQAGMDAHYFWDRYDLAEVWTDIDGDFAIGVSGFDIGIGTDFTYQHVMQDVRGVNMDDGSFTFALNPSILYKENRLELDMGVNMVVGNQDKSFYFYPDLNLRYAAIEDYMSVYAHLTGDYNLNSYEAMSNINPFMSSYSETFGTDLLKIDVGLEGILLPKLSYRIGVEHRKANGAIAWVEGQETTAELDRFIHGNAYMALQDTTSLTSIKGEFNYDENKKYRFGLSAVYNMGSSERFDEVLYMPQFELGVHGQAFFREKFKVGGEIKYVGARSGAEESTTEPGTFITTDLKGYADINLHAGYMVTERLEAFMKLNNVAGQNYLRYTNYPVQGFQALAGLRFSF